MCEEKVAQFLKKMEIRKKKKRENIKEINNRSGLNQVFLSLVCFRLVEALRITLKNEGKPCVESQFYTPEEALLS